MTADELDALGRRIAVVGLADRGKLAKLLATIRRRAAKRQRTSELEARLDAALKSAELALEERRSAAYTLEYPESLPITAAREEILAAIAAHRVVVVCGDTGSGKTTQLPKLCLEAGRGLLGMIGHTQPRRIAAQAVAARLAEELDVRLGETVGLEVRFTDQTGPRALIKVMTDGILLNEIRGDRRLSTYDTLIIDEAHERSLNIDFILGYLKRIERERPDLKVIITSATIDPERFAEHFGGVPIVRVPGRSFPVEMRYRPLAEDEELATAIVAATQALAGEQVEPANIRDMLVFLPGERWIRDAQHALARHGPRGYDVLPLYARLTNARQRQILNPGKAPRIVLATNIAETSLTVPRIRYVVDSGLARVSRYSTRHRVQSLGVESIARANATQRAGRCGRLAPGVCIRLFAEEDFLARPEFMEPEILRTGLAGVLLRLEALRLAPIERFPFIDVPPPKAVNDAYQLLYVLGAVDGERRLTDDGTTMARLPVDPRLARLLIVANRNGALREGLVIAAALSVVDPREYPGDALEAARRAHEEFADPRSDFVTLLNLWMAYRRERRRGERALREWSKERFLSVTRLKEWHDVHGQLHELVQGLGWRTRDATSDYRAIHQAVLAAFIDFIAEHEQGTTYRGMREVRAALFPGTPLARKRPRWLVAAERIQTERHYLKTVAQVNPRWALRVAPHLVRFDYLDPMWDVERGQVTAREIVMLFGLTLGSERRIDYGKVEPANARRMFIVDALAADRLGAVPEPAFLAHNRRLCRAVLDWEARLRKRDLFIGEPGLVAFYDARLPRDVRDCTSLVTWCANPANDESLQMQPGDVASRDLAALPSELYPAQLALADQELTLSYAFDPGEEHDGVTLMLPQALLGAIRPEPLEWLVPGWLAEKVMGLLRTLPKGIRRSLVPLPDTAGAIQGAVERRAGQMPLVNALCEALLEERGITVAASAFDDTALAPHLKMRIAVVDADGNVRAAGRDLRALQREQGVSLRASTPPALSGTESYARQGLTVWDFGDLPEVINVAQRPRDLALYPALLDRDGRVDLQLLPPGPAAVEQHRRGVRRLLLKSLPQQVALIREQTLAERDLVLAYHGIADTAALLDDLLCASADECFVLEPPIRSRARFDECLDAGRAELVQNAEALRELLRELLPIYRKLRSALAADVQGTVQAAVRNDIAEQLDELVQPYFLTLTPPPQRRHLKRYLRAAQMRWEKRGERRQAEQGAIVRTAAGRLVHWRASWPPGWPWPEAIDRYRWLVEELRVSLFAQALGTVAPVSAKRLEAAWRKAVESTARATG